MRSRAPIAILVAVALLALLSLAAVASADGPQPVVDKPEPGSAVAELGPKNYSKNSAGGDFAGTPSGAEAALIKRGMALNDAAASEAPHAEVDEGFAWGDAAIGAGITLLLIALPASLVVARRRLAATRPEPAGTWSS